MPLGCDKPFLKIVHISLKMGQIAKIKHIPGDFA
jgi:hypothetical protein